MGKTGFFFTLRAMLVLGAIGVLASESLAQAPTLVVSLITNPSGTTIRSTDKLRVAANVANDPGPFTYRWGYTAGGDTLWSEDQTIFSWTFNDARAPLFTPGTTVTFIVRVTALSGMQGQASAMRQINLAPSGGRLTVTPLTGTALQTTFTLSAQGWTDDADVSALRFRFLRSDGSGVKSLLREWSFASTYSAKLPQGPLAGEQMDVFVEVCDALDDTGRAVSRITVTLSPPPPGDSLPDPNPLDPPPDDSTGVILPPIDMPVELQNFSAKAQEGRVLLQWRTATETDNYGFDIQCRDAEGEGWERVGFTSGHGTTSAPHAYSYSHVPTHGGLHVYRLKQIDRDGSFSYSNELNVFHAAASFFALGQNYPNPFNPSTTIVFHLPAKASTSLKIFDALGRQTAVLASEELSAGRHARTWDASGLPGGVYFYRLQSGTLAETKKLLLLQ